MKYHMFVCLYKSQYMILYAAHITIVHTCIYYTVFCMWNWETITVINNFNALQESRGPLQKRLPALKPLSP